MKIGLLCAMKSEFDQLTPYLHITRETDIARTTVLEGDIDGLAVVIAATGICKVNAAITAQLLIDKFDVTHILMVGVAGGMDPRLGVHALAFSERLAQHDVNWQWLRHRPAPAEGYFPGDPMLLSVCKKLAEDGKFLYPAFFGTMVSGEQFIAEEGRQEIIDAWHPLCVDMESAAAAHACMANDIPFLAIRAISDTAETG
ncbi:MAG: 5'-methylthioadenosine/S-adenosylhomocysteine nucleosidase, partial [Clostridia bacterium]|nr:5'-methylthioadenosine/S-adenosylhomocysteine nucleosidase [Clostridia bacterium]